MRVYIHRHTHTSSHPPQHSANNHPNTDRPQGHRRASPGLHQGGHPAPASSTTSAPSQGRLSRCSSSSSSPSSPRQGRLAGRPSRCTGCARTGAPPARPADRRVPAGRAQANLRHRGGRGPQGLGARAGRRSRGCCGAMREGIINLKCLRWGERGRGRGSFSRWGLACFGVNSTQGINHLFFRFRVSGRLM